MNIFVRSTNGRIHVNCNDNGSSHLNVHQSSDYDISRSLACGARSRFVHSVLGDFLSVSGFMLYACHREDDRYRTHIGKLDSAYQRNVNKHPMYAVMLEEALHCRFKHNPELYHRFMEKSDLPITSYFFYGSTLRDLYSISQDCIRPLNEIAKGRELMKHV